ncbi:hypothetical protein BOTBODRAFT_26095 [Botryobasidium botryosum FD-172 SS1]|uniref:Uncharacterized protein n=1 Tax=Botryobasidium botryosum (strain FD-172 SS1) TaxID=930990 RepID=A0A067N3W4_BOTB1|nr:hypothetical protein BOTBODRAFT_26095 [Botryobasidium botryosum FD-172 SS1]
MGPTPDLESELAKIRPHVNSRLAHQKTPAALLAALDATFSEQATDPSPVAYFAALTTTLEQALHKDSEQGRKLDLEEGALVPAILYLLAIVVPTVPTPILRANLSSLLPVLAPLFPVLSRQAPPLRSHTAIFAALIPSLEAQHLSTPQLRQAFASILELTLDPRPKVRKKAQEAVLSILSAPPRPLVQHPYVSQVADFVILALGAVDRGAGRGKGDKAAESIEVGIWCCAFVKSISAFWPATHLDKLLTAVLALPRISSPYLTSAAFTLIAVLLKAPAESFTPSPEHYPTILNALMASTPPTSTPELAQPWLEAVENTMVAFSRSDEEHCSKQLSTIWNACWAWLKIDDPGCRTAAAKALSAMARYCVSVDMIKDAAGKAQSEKRLGKTTLGGIIRLLAQSLDALLYVRAVPHLLQVLTALISRLRVRPFLEKGGPGSRPPTAAQILLQELVKQVGELRVAKKFEHRERADEVLGMAIEVMGPEAFLEILPLNLLPEDADKGGRGFLLSLIASHTTNTRLSHFTLRFIPLSEKFFELQTKAIENDKMIEAKVWESCIDQVWSCLKGYCDLCIDLREAFTIPFARLITQLLYTQPTLRTPILVGLRTLLRTNKSLSTSSAPPAELISSFGIDQEEARKNIDFLASLAGNLLAVLFNVFGNVGVDGRSLVGEVVSEWLGIAREKDIEGTYTKLTTHLIQSLASPVPPQASTLVTPVPHTMLDLLVILVPYLPPAQSAALFTLALGPELMESPDATVQKKSYRVLARLVESGKVAVGGTDKLIQRLSESAESVSPAAKRDRLHLLTCIVPALTPAELHFIPSILTEAVLATKEVGEKSRNEAFDLLVAMGKKMKEGGVIQRGLVDGMEEDGAGDVRASIEEYVTMVAAGLAGTTPHMISASITAISRIVFEFKDSLPESMHSDLITTIVVFLSSANREIVKSALGFAKLAIITLPVPTLRPHLSELVPALLGWSHDHKNHFKLKVRHIFERMIRRVGFEDVMKEAGENENRKVLLNIKKRKERAKKKRTGKGGEEGSDDEEAPAKPTAGDAFEDVLYGSESEIDSEEDEDGPQGGDSNTAHRSRKNKSTKTDTHLRIDDDEPMDLLHGTAAKVTSASTDRRRKPGQEASHFRTEEDTGKMIIDESSDEEEEEEEEEEEDVVGTAYQEQMTSADGFTRGPKGQVKFNKNTKKRRAEEDAMDIDVEESKPAPKQSKAKRQEVVKLGQEFKAKKAGGDVKRHGQHDPYAYMTLSQIGKGKKGGKGSRLSLTGKK